MTTVEVTNLIATAATSALLPGFTLAADEGLPFTPADKVVRMWVEPQGATMTALGAKQFRDTLKVTFAVYARADLGQGVATAQADALYDPKAGPFRMGCALRPGNAGTDYLNGRAPSRKWIEGKDAKAFPGFFVACALVTLDHYFRAAAAA